MELYVVLALLLIQCCAIVFGDDLCYVDDTSSFQTCENGCCGRSYENNQRCCSDTDVLVWIIIGGIIGGLLFISCVVAVGCCLIKSNGKKGRVVNPGTTQPGQTTTVYQVPVHQGALPSYSFSSVPRGPPAYMDAPPPYSQGPLLTHPSAPPYPQEPSFHHQSTPSYPPYPQGPPLQQPNGHSFLPPIQNQHQQFSGYPPQGQNQPTNQSDGQVPGPASY